DEGVPLPPEPGVDEWTPNEEYAMPQIVGSAQHAAAETGTARAANGNGQPANGYANGNGNGHSNGNGNGYANGNGHAPAANGNGHSNGNGHAPAANGNGAAVSIVPRPRRRVTLPEAQPSEGQAPPPPSGPRFHLHIYLPRTGDFDADIKRMMQINEVLCLHEGDQAVTLYLPNAVGQVMMEPNRRIAPVEPLVQRLADMLGTENVILERVDLAA
ncbi:MAG TPA: hypothetical protein VGE07_08125, partial [Herpetosiphonaceae bacterium]